MQKHLVAYCFTGILILCLSACGGKTKETTTFKPTDNIDSLVIQYPDSLEILLKHGQHYYDQYRFEMAISSASKAFRIDSNNLKARMLYANIQNNKPDRTIEEVMVARRHFSVVYKADPKNTEALIGIASTFFSF